MGPIEALVLGIVQGLTEFLPISSTGHLVLLPALLQWCPQWCPPPLVFDTTVHLGTLLAVVVVFWRDLLRLIAAWWQGVRHGRLLATAESRLAWWIIIGTLPAIVAGLLLEDKFEQISTPRYVGAFLLVTALLLVLAELLGRRRRDLESLTWLDSLLVGIAQAVAIIPGLSRSGATMSTAMMRGLKREAAARFSFLLAIPVIAGAGIVQLVKLVERGSLQAEVLPLLIGLLAAALCGYAAIRFLLAYLRRLPLYPFAVYCVVVGLVALLAL